jgi:autophagy-related protein 2
MCPAQKLRVGQRSTPIFVFQLNITADIIQAITSMLIGLPIKLHDGSISAATARIPSSNTLNSTVGLTIHSLHLTFHLIPSSSEPIDLSATKLSAPVTSAAMSFIHDELTPPEETTLRESFHPDLLSSFHEHIHDMPGSMDPFPHDVDEEGSHPEVDPTGIVIFATLIKRLCASSELDAFDTEITITNPAHASFTFSVAEIRYRIQGAVGGAFENNIGTEAQASEASRKVSISGLTVSSRDLRPPFPFQILLTPSPASSPSPTRSSRFPASPLDEDAVLNISQSLANLQLQLAPDAPEPSSSKMNDMYASTPLNLSEHDVIDCRRPRNVEPSPEEHSSPDTNHNGFSFDRECKDTGRKHDFEPEDEVILSHCAEPILIGLGKPRASPGFSEHSFAHPKSAQERNKFADANNVKYTFSAGVLAFAFRAWHIRSVLDMLDVWDSYHHVCAVLDPPANQSPVPSFADTLCTLGIDATMKIRGIVLLLLPSRNLVEPCSLDNFFANPLAPPRLPHGCVRIFLDGLSTSCSLSKSTPPISHTHPRAAASAATSAVTTDFALDDLSAFALLSTQTLEIHDRELSASPIIITDRNLPMQYPTAHIHPGIKVKENHDYPSLSKFPILDWTAKSHQTNSAEISKWRTKIQEKSSESLEKKGVGVSPFPIDSDQNIGSVDEPEAIHTPAIDLHARFIWTSAEEGLISGNGLDDHVELDVVPLHVFCDLGLVLGDNALVFVNEAASRYTDREECPNNNQDGERDGDAANAATETVFEKERLDCLASETQRFDLEDKHVRKVGLERSTSVRQADKVRSRPFIALYYFILLSFAAVSANKFLAAAGNCGKFVHDKVSISMPALSSADTTFGSCRP